MSTRTIRVSLAKWLAQGDEAVDALARQSVQEMAKLVVLTTPVDTGFLRGSWQPSLGEDFQVKDPGSVALDPKGGTVLSAIGLTIAGMKAGSRFWMMNGCAYAIHVEEGTSTMPGRHYVGDTVKRWPGVVRRVVRDLGLAP